VNSLHDLRILSANLARGREPAESFAALARAVDADVVAVQELARIQADALARIFPFGALHVHPNRMGIALRMPGLVRQVALPGRNAYVASVHLNSGTIVDVMNVHILAPHAGLPWQTASIRRRQICGIEAYLHRSGRAPLILVGDLNSTPIWPAYRRLSKMLTDGATAAARARGCFPRRTWGLWYGPKLLRIDHALVRGVSVENVEIRRLTRSDHSAVIVDVRVGEDKSFDSTTVNVDQKASR
jgi:endonuclease/exonuclease/phosphatase (EEP) superfamily protein YafD